MNNLNQNVPEKLIALRGEKSQTEVAKAVGVSRSAICMYESGERVPRDEVKCKIADYYKKTVGEIFFDTDSQIVNRH